MESDSMVEGEDSDDRSGPLGPLNKTHVSRMSRKLNEKMRRDRLNSLIAELAEQVPTIKYAHRRLDKSSVLRLTVSFLKLHQGLKRKNVARANIFKDRILYNRVNMMNDGALMVMTQSGLILYVSPAVKQILGYHQSDVIGFDISRFVHPDDVSCFCRYGDDGDKVKKEAAYATFNKSNEFQQPQNIQFEGGGQHTFYARMLRVTKSARRREDEEGEEEDRYELMQVQMHRESLEDIGTGESLWLVANIKPFVQESIKELSVSVSEFQKNNEWATMHGLDGKILAVEHRASLFHGFMASETIGKSPYFFISEDDLEYVCRSHQLIITDEEIPSTVFRMKTVTESPLYVQSRSIIIKDQWTKKPKCIVSTNEVLSVDMGQKMLEYQKQKVDELTAAQEKSENAEQKHDRNILDADSIGLDAPASFDTNLSDSETDNSLSGSEGRASLSSLRLSPNLKSEVLQIHKCTGRTLGELYEEEALRYHDTLQRNGNSMSSPPSSDESSYSVKRPHDSLDGENTDNSSQEACSCGESSLANSCGEARSSDSISSGNLCGEARSSDSFRELSSGNSCGDSRSGTSDSLLDHLLSLEQMLSSTQKCQAKISEESELKSTSRPILKGILEGRLTFVGKNKYSVTDKEIGVGREVGGVNGQNSMGSLTDSCDSSVIDDNTGCVSEARTKRGERDLDQDLVIEDAESERPFGPVQSPTIDSACILEDLPLDRSNISFTKQLLTKYGPVKEALASHGLTHEMLRHHLATTDNTDQLTD